jgi:hypothetical protein
VKCPKRLRAVSRLSCIRCCTSQAGKVGTKKSQDAHCFSGPLLNLLMREWVPKTSHEAPSFSGPLPSIGTLLNCAVERVPKLPRSLSQLRRRYPILKGGDTERVIRSSFEAIEKEGKQRQRLVMLVLRSLANLPSNGSGSETRETCNFACENVPLTETGTKQ